MQLLLLRCSNRRDENTFNRISLSVGVETRIPAEDTKCASRSVFVYLRSSKRTGNGMHASCEVVRVLPKWIHCTLSNVGPDRVVIVIFTCVHRNWHFRDEIANTLMKIWMQHIKNTQTNDDYSLFIALWCASLSLCASNLREMTQSKAHERDDDDIKTNTCTSRWAVNHPHVARLRILRLFWYFALEIYIRHGSSNVNGIFFAFYYRRQFWNNHKWKTPTDRHRARAHTHTFRLPIRSKSALHLCNWIIMHVSRLDTGRVCVLSFNGNVFSTARCESLGHWCTSTCNWQVLDESK